MANNLTERFKTVFRHTAQNVAVITSRNLTGDVHGVTIGSSSSLSITPPSICFSLNLNSQTHQAIVQHKFFALNYLSSTQENIAQQFASNIDNRFENINYNLDSKYNQPIIAGSLSSMILECHAMHEYNQHVVIIGQVEEIISDISENNTATPLLYYKGKYNNVPTL